MCKRAFKMQYEIMETEYVLTLGTGSLLISIHAITSLVIIRFLLVMEKLFFFSNNEH